MSKAVIKRTVSFDTQYYEIDLQMAELNAYLLDDVLIMASQYFTDFMHSVWKAKMQMGNSGRASKSVAMRRIIKGINIHPLKLHFIFKDLSKLSQIFPKLGNKRVVFSVLESLGSFHFLGPRFVLNVTSTALVYYRRGKI